MDVLVQIQSRAVMSWNAPGIPLPLRIERFDPAQASTVAGWVADVDELRQLAPGTPPPLTPLKVLRWKKSGGTAWQLGKDEDRAVIGYAELNPMKSTPSHLWLGHVIVRPDERGHGYGGAFVRSLVCHAFDAWSAERVILVVFPDNKSAIRCYRRVGFGVVGEECHRFEAGGAEERLLRLEIATRPSEVGERTPRGFDRTAL